MKNTYMMLKFNLAGSFSSILSSRILAIGCQSGSVSERMRFEAKKPTQPWLMIWNDIPGSQSQHRKLRQDFALARELCAKRVAKIYPELHRLALELLK